MARTSFACIHEETIATVQGRAMTLLVSDGSGDPCIMRSFGQGGWGVVYEEQRPLSRDFCPYSAAVERAQRIADGLEPCPPPIF